MSDHPADTPPPHELAQRVLAAEADAVRAIRLTPAFDAAVDLLANLPGSAVVAGLGKSGIIAQKLAATLASTGTPAHFMHAVEAMHGDLGRLHPHDAAILLSYSGNTDELVHLAAVLRQDHLPVVAITSTDDCDLARLATHTLPVGRVEEACPLNLAPSASTTAMLALGDALALAVSERRGFTADDFHKRHPKGDLGKQLMAVTEAMRFRVGDNLPLIPHHTPIRDAFALAQPTDPTLRRAGALLVTDDEGLLAGVFTDGDLRRLVFTNPAALDLPIAHAMTTTPTTLQHTAVVRDAVRLIREKRIDEIPVVNDSGQPVGLIDVQDLVALRVVEG
ncbi:MAG: KpsF/GutQ family sugar-phosphate isomerase [Planctomycetota bacterium]